MSAEYYADPECPECAGKGWIYASSMLTLPGEKGGHYCRCAQDFLKIKNMERVWKSLSEAPMPAGLRDEPPLRRLLRHNVWMTAKEKHLKAHLKALAFSMNDMWDARVYSDKDLLKAWLNTAYAQGHKIYDTEISESMVTVKAMYIDELVEPPDLVVLVLGVKQAPNKETPNVLLEAVRSRMHIGKPMWIVDQPDGRIDQMHHRGYSEQLEGLLAHWPHVRLTATGLVSVAALPDHVSDDVANDPSEAEEILKDDKDDEVEGGDEIDEALADLDEDEDEEEEEEDDEVPPTRKPNFLDEIEQNEEEQDRRSQSKPRRKPWKKKGGRR